MDNWELYYRTHKDKGSNAITGVPPLTFVSNGENLVDYRIDGASGGVGDRTANLYNESAAVDTNYYINNNGNSVIGNFGDRFLRVRLNVTPSTYYVFSWLNVLSLGISFPRINGTLSLLAIRDYNIPEQLSS